MTKAVQPDYRKWNAVKVGMSRARVTALLGEPLQNVLAGRSYAAYGYITYPALPHRYSMCCLVAFDERGQVRWKCDPFGGPLSLGRRPSKPRLIYPIEGSRYTHYPGVLDIRWFPCSGEYPMVYDLEVGAAMPESADYSDALEPQEHGQPYAVIQFPGSQPGRVRVRGRNAAGAGPWFDFHALSFDD